MIHISPLQSQLILWIPMVAIALIAWWATRPAAENDDLADLWTTYRHHWTDDEGEAA